MECCYLDACKIRPAGPTASTFHPKMEMAAVAVRVSVAMAFWRLGKSATTAILMTLMRAFAHAE